MVVAQKGDTHVAFLEVEDEALHVVGEREELAGHGVGETVDAGDTVTHREHGARFLDREARVVALDLLANDAADFVGADFHSAVR